MKILLNIPQELKDKLQEKAKVNNRSMNKEITQAIEDHVNTINVPLVGAVIDGKIYLTTKDCDTITIEEELARR